METSTFNYIAQIISEYPITDMYIGRLEKEKEITVVKHKELVYLRDNQRAVGRVLKKCITSVGKGVFDNITYDIIYELYLRETAILNLDGIANKTHLSVSQVKKRRQAFFKEVARERGIRI
ncbi:hypothetical protein [Liquorilactobacillus cacaonum]|uniref:Uncharacterized protein n=1 Tax=Liquorilactobacillus cacaonum DSM 21116 TaxID=1423729 RepID=A0A0R2CIN8_9LACO|nr:hypothetical protein [Liquorilactobacillus cacaonum]KRM91480.1 hypothetical protein FC80_GL000447 [Liquorilactobacillus cacaonum DSM 21116]